MPLKSHAPHLHVVATTHSFRALGLVSTPHTYIPNAAIHIKVVYGEVQNPPRHRRPGRVPFAKRWLTQWELEITPPFTTLPCPGICQSRRGGKDPYFLQITSAVTLNLALALSFPASLSLSLSLSLALSLSLSRSLALSLSLSLSLSLLSLSLSLSLGLFCLTLSHCNSALSLSLSLRLFCLSLSLSLSVSSVSLYLIVILPSLSLSLSRCSLLLSLSSLSACIIHFKG
ncbi:unnamed protein product [Boreogadus saida]